ncbi:MAG: reverse transcriptase domain-containing protein [Bacteroidota bacterium]
MAHNHKFLDIVHKLGKKGYPLSGVYRRIQDKELFLAAYGKLYANSGATTAGTDPEDTVDGMSIERIEKILQQLHDGTYQWKPVRRVKIPKANGKQRPLGLPSWSDKLLQEVIRMVLEAYYEPRFSPYSHGFRPHRSCHTALKQIHHSWKGTKWFIEGDIKGCFDNIDHYVLLEILARNIKDNRFLKLIRQMLQAGYLEEWQYHSTYSGTPQGGVVSPILANIFLNELDQFVENELIPAYKKGKRRKVNLEYGRINGRLRFARKTGKKDLAKELEKQRRQLPLGDPNDPDYRSLRYSRYADDFLLGFAGPRTEAEEIKQKIMQFLKTIKLELSEEKTLLTHATTQPAHYLGYDIRVVIDNNQMTKQNKQHTRHRSRAINMLPVLAVPPQISRAWRMKYTRNGKPANRPELLQCSDFEIVKTYGSELRGIVNYYSMAYNVAHSFNPVKHMFMESAARTLANKHKISRSSVFAKYKRTGEQGVKALIVKVPNPKRPDKPYYARLGDHPIRTSFATAIPDKVEKFYVNRNDLVQRLLADTCELCGSQDGIAVHHIRKLADIQKKFQGRKSTPDWAKFMLARNRKTVVVCHHCHTQIHAGTYDSTKVNKD